MQSGVLNVQNINFYKSSICCEKMKVVWYVNDFDSFVLKGCGWGVTVRGDLNMKLLFERNISKKTVGTCFQMTKWQNHFRGVT